jgi:hypothetical protein
MYTGPGEPYSSNIPPWHILANVLNENGMKAIADTIWNFVGR